MKPRSPLFEKMGASFDRAFGNADAVFVINGVSLPPVRVIFRRWREMDQMEQDGQGAETITHLLSVSQSKVPGLQSQRDSVTIHELDPSGTPTGAQQTFLIKNHTDDARSMLRIYLSGDI